MAWTQRGVSVWAVKRWVSTSLFLTLFHPPLCYSPAGREQTGTFFFHIPLPHTPSVKRNTRMLTGWATFPFPSEVQEVFLDNAALDLQDADLKARRNLSRPAYDIKLHSKNGAQYTLWFEGIFPYSFFTGVLPVFWILHFIALCFRVNRNVLQCIFILSLFKHEIRSFFCILIEKKK